MPHAVMQMFPRVLAIAGLCVLASACRPEAAAPATQVPPGEASSDTVTATSTAPGVHWEHGMAYATLRSRLLSLGWAPLPDAQCLANVVGANHATLCAADARPCQPCQSLPELSACSGTGHCTLQFQSDGGKRLSVSTYGDVHRRTPSGEPEDLVVTAVSPASF